MDSRVYLLTGCIGLIGANSLSLAPIAVPIGADFGNPPLTQVLWAAGGFGLGTAFSALTIAPFIDRFGGLNMLRCAMGVLIICFYASAGAPSLWVLILFQTIAGLASGVAIPATYGIGSEISPKGQEAQTMGFILTGWMLAMIFGVTCATVVADLLNWRFLFTGFATLCSGMLVGLFLIAVPPTPRRAVTSPLTALSIPGIGRGMVVTLAYMLAFYGTYPFLTPNIVDNLGLPASTAALPILGYGIGFGASSVLDKWLDRHTYSHAASRVFILTALALATLALGSGNYAVLVVAMGAYGFVNHAGLTLIVNRLIDLDPTKKGAVLGIYAALTYAAVTIGAIGFAPIYQIAGYAGCATLAAILALSMAAEARAKIGAFSS